MSGNRLALTLLHELRRRGGGTGAAALCGGGGQGDALHRAHRLSTTPWTARRGPRHRRDFFIGSMFGHRLDVR